MYFSFSASLSIWLEAWPFRDPRAEGHSPQCNGLWIRSQIPGLPRSPARSPGIEGWWKWRWVSTNAPHCLPGPIPLSPHTHLLRPESLTSPLPGLLASGLHTSIHPHMKLKGPGFYFGGSSCFYDNMFQAQKKKKHPENKKIHGKVKSMLTNPTTQFKITTNQSGAWFYLPQSLPSLSGSLLSWNYYCFLKFPCMHCYIFYIYVDPWTIHSHVLHILKLHIHGIYDSYSVNSLCLTWFCNSPPTVLALSFIFSLPS